jgi:hypothetical protein
VLAGSSARVSLEDKNSAVVSGRRAEDSLNLLRVVTQQAEQESLWRCVEAADEEIAVEQSQQFLVA